MANALKINGFQSNLGVSWHTGPTWPAPTFQLHVVDKSMSRGAGVVPTIARQKLIVRL